MERFYKNKKEDPILMGKLKNALKKAVPGGLEFTIRNIIINGTKRGCSGFVKNPENGVVVYIDTEPCVLSSVGYLVRYARDEKDFTGCRNRTNHWCLKDIVDEVKQMLENVDDWKREVKI